MGRVIGLVTREDLKASASSQRRASPGVDPERLKEFACKACPLNRARLVSPKMEAVGPKTPGGLYIVGEMPSAEDDRTGSRFSGDGGRLLRRSLGRFAASARWASVLRCHKGSEKPIGDTEVACCRGFLERDIEESAPKVIFAVGPRAISWFGATGGAFIWRGRMFPAKIGKHLTWIVPLRSPDDIEREQDGRAGREWSDLWARDINRGLSALRTAPPPRLRSDLSDFLKELKTLFGGPGDLERLRSALEALETGAGPIAFDVETFPLRPYGRDARLLSIAFASGDGRALGLALEHPQAKWGRDLDAALDLLRQFFVGKKKTFIGQNLIFDLEHLVVRLRLKPRHYFKHDWLDTMAQGFILDERQGALSLSFLSFQQFGVDVKKLAPVGNKDDLRAEPLPALLTYNMLDAAATFDLAAAQKARISSAGLDHALRFHCRHIPTLVRAQTLGVPVDVARVRALQVKYSTAIDGLMTKLRSRPECAEFRRRMGEDFDDKSNKHVEFMLREILRRADGLNEETGKYSVDEGVLAKIGHPITRIVLDLRGFRKLRSTYVEPYIPGSADALIYDDGKIHTNYKPQRAATGRLASEDPNLQNFPKRDKDSREVRSIIVPPRGWVITAVDYGQIEARVIAVMSKDPRFIRALWDRYDIHQHWAEIIARRYPRVLTIHSKETEAKAQMKDLRSKTKNGIVFPAFFKASEKSIARSMEIPDEIMSGIFRMFWDEFRAIKGWHQRLIDGYSNNGYVETMLGRRRYYSVENGPLTPNAIVNTPVQGTAADIMLDAMDRLARKSIELDRPYLAPRMTIHDDLTFFLPKSKLDESIEIITREMVLVPWTWARSVPWTAEVSVGKNWEEMTEILKVSSDEISGGASRPKGI